MLRSIRERTIVVTTGCLVFALLINTLTNFLITRQDNQQSQQDILKSTSISHSMAISDWINSKMTMISSLQSVALNEDEPLPSITRIADAGDFIKVYIGYAGSKTALFSDPTGIPDGDDPTVRPWYQQAVSANAPVITMPYVDLGTGKLVVTFAIPVKENGVLKSVLAGDVAMDNVVANVQSIRPTPASSGLLLSNEGIVIAANSPNLTLRSFNDVVSGADFKTLASGKHISGYFNGAEKTLAAVPVKGTNWLLVVALDSNDSSAGMFSLLKASALSFIILVTAGATVVHIVVGRLMRRLLTVRDMMDAIANGTNDLSQRLPESGQDEVAQIARAFNAFSDKLSVVMVQLRDSSTSLENAAQEIAAGNQNLSDRTEHAASCLRETASAVEQITASVAQSTESAAEANEQVRHACLVASRGEEIVLQAIATMQSIEEASAKIGDITSTIDSIAFQTNILALNAAVEAARAGEQGRGFAVVAEEVRNLAGHSAQAAKNIKLLIDSTIESVATVSHYVHIGGENMQEIVTDIGKVSGRMGEISIATNEQMKGIQEINHSVINLDKMVQQNAELVVESAAATAALLEQAAELAKTAGHFRI